MVRCLPSSFRTTLFLVKTIMIFGLNYSMAVELSIWWMMVCFCFKSVGDTQLFYTVLILIAGDGKDNM